MDDRKLTRRGENSGFPRHTHTHTHVLWRDGAKTHYKQFISETHKNSNNNRKKSSDTDGLVRFNHLYSSVDVNVVSTATDFWLSSKGFDVSLKEPFNLTL